MPAETGSDVVDAILHAAHRIRSAADADLREDGLSLPGYKLLKALARADRSMREVSEVLHVSPRTVTDMIDGLEARGLVTRCPHSSDRRVTLLHLTEAGSRQLAAAASSAERARAAAVSALSQDDQQALRSLLDRIAAADRG